MTLKPIPGFPGYFASDDGNIWSTVPCRKLGGGIPATPRQLKGCVAARGYRIVTICVGGKRYSKKVCRLVLDAFVGPQPELMACHGPKGKLDDSLSNLQWGTGEKNQADRKRDQTDGSGERHPRAKLTLAQVDVIRSLRGKMSQSEIGKMYGVTQVTVSRIHLGKNWRAA